MSTIKQLRAEIDKTDALIIKKIAKRMQLSRKIGMLKAKSALKVTDKKREKELMHFYENICAKVGLNVNFVKRLFKSIFVESKKTQRF